MDRNSKAEWYFAHTLATLASFTVVVLVCMRLYLSANSLKSVHWPAAAGWLLLVGCAASLWLWIRLLVDFFGRAPARNPVMWGFILIGGMIFGAIPYFWLVWRPRNRPSPV
jgi:hypothetical protein